MNKFTVQGKLQQTPPGSLITAPLNAGTRLIINFVSLGPKFDQKLDKAIEKVWRKVREDYFGWSGDFRTFKLGSIKDTLVNSDTLVVNLLVRDKEGIVDATGLEQALKKLAEFAKVEKGSVHISQLLIDEVPALKDLVKKYLSEIGINCYFYESPVEKR